jgi:hypothetical protein
MEPDAWVDKLHLLARFIAQSSLRGLAAAKDVSRQPFATVEVAS